jgi:integrase
MVLGVECDSKVRQLRAKIWRLPQRATKRRIWNRKDAKKLLESIPRGDLSGLRDRALISVMLYSFARVSAVLSLKRQDFQHRGARRWLRYHEKGGKEHEMPAHHQIEEALDEYDRRERFGRNPHTSFDVYLTEGV